MDYVALKAELDGAHPITGVYDANDALARDELNALNIVRIKANMTGAEIIEATDTAEYTALLDDQKNRFLTFTSGNETINPELGGIAQEILVDVFGGGSNTIVALGALRNETVSRASDIGLGPVNLGDVQNARAL